MCDLMTLSESDELDITMDRLTEKRYYTDELGCPDATSAKVDGHSQALIDGMRACLRINKDYRPTPQELHDYTSDMLRRHRDSRNDSTHTAHLMSRAARNAARINVARFNAAADRLYFRRNEINDLRLRAGRIDFLYVPGDWDLAMNSTYVDRGWTALQPTSAFRQAAMKAGEVEEGALVEGRQALRRRMPPMPGFVDFGAQMDAEPVRGAGGDGELSNKAEADAPPKPPPSTVRVTPDPSLIPPPQELATRGAWPAGTRNGTSSPPPPPDSVSGSAPFFSAASSHSPASSEGMANGRAAKRRKWSF